ncbi:efflux RND transporter periplasmic adaptor subunit [Vibrio alfacsensis]|uniref:HlyD family secretion protein n=1 Tax=Vibrio alfacsensis TaxID=1074311 RepID=UPI002ADD4FC1|nr:biotin/lipoyl-binding protein [Vibrio alfacsensis]WQE78470.1 efflux RND transporter periplasmic adaptor subunit [Vibrio alfacsensis]
MKEIMLPYILIVWLLFKFNVLKRTGRNYFITTSIGMFLLVSLFLGHRFFSPIDLTNSTTVKAPHSVLSPALGQQIETVFVDHNSHVKKGDVLYTLVDDKITASISEINSSIDEMDKTIEAQCVKLAQAKRNLDRNRNLDQHVSLKELEESQDSVELLSAEMDVLIAKQNGMQARKKSLTFDLSRLTVRAPFDGLITHVFIADGSRVGSLHIWDTSKKFVEMRIPDQTFDNIKPGQFSEFYIDTYPGQIFRARVHSLVKATGESQGNLLPQEQGVSAHIQRGSAPVGRTVILEIDDNTMEKVPIGATGSAWISASKPYPILGFIDIIGGATLRLTSVKSYLFAI